MSAVLTRFKTVSAVSIEEYRDKDHTYVYVDGHIYPGRYEHALKHYEEKEQHAPANKS